MDSIDCEENLAFAAGQLEEAGKVPAKLLLRLGDRARQLKVLFEVFEETAQHAPDGGALSGAAHGMVKDKGLVPRHLAPAPRVLKPMQPVGENCRFADSSGPADHERTTRILEALLLAELLQLRQHVGSRDVHEAAARRATCAIQKRAGNERRVAAEAAIISSSKVPQRESA
eukprot:scaffold7342_cov269-Pinguiococcus_pyrenoidosus.AAC.14